MGTSKASTSRRWRTIVDYLDATRNEIAIDEAMLRISGLEVERAGYIPRVPKWAAYAKRFPYLVRNAARAAWLLWFLGAGVALLFLEFLPRWMSAVRARSGASAPISPGYVLALSSRVGDIVNTRTFPDLPDVWITMPWAPLQRAPVDAKLVDVFSLLSPQDLVRALCDATVAQRRLFRRSATRRWALQGYTAFKWFAVRAAIDKLSGAIIMAEHFDRWAILVDRSVRRSGRHLTLIQHGSVVGVDGKNEAGYMLGNLPAKLNSVARLYVYGRDDDAIFRQYFLGEAARSSDLDVQYFKPRIELHPSTNGTALKLLFVGHPLCEAAHSTLFQLLRDRATISAYYKPHPLAPMSTAMAAVGWQVITDSKHFPEVDLLISYPSTLVVEYAALDIPAVVHPLNVDVQQCDTLAQEVLAHVRTAVA